MLYEIRTKAKEGGGPLWVGHFEADHAEEALRMAGAYCTRHGLRFVSAVPWLDFDRTILDEAQLDAGGGALTNRHVAGPTRTRGV
jgi:hypothetical protein